MVSKKALFVAALAVLLITFASGPENAFAAIRQDGIDSTGVLDEALNRFETAAQSWSEYITEAARFIFWSLAAISLTWTFGAMLLRKSDLQEFFAEFVKFCLFIGFFKWLLESGPVFSADLFNSFKSIAGNASGLDGGLTPSTIIDVGFKLFGRVIDESNQLDFSETILGGIMAAIVLVVTALISVNMVMLLTCAWVLSYAGIILLGFGGSRWTSDIAIGYYKAVLGIAVQLMVMTLIVGIGQQFLDEYAEGMSTKDFSVKEVGVVLTVSVMLLFLVDKLPGFVSSIAGGPSAPQFGQSHAIGAAKTAMGGVAMAGATLVGGAASIGGIGKGIGAAYKKAAQETDNGTSTGIAGNSGGSGGSENQGGAGSASSGGSSSGSTAAGSSASSSSSGGGGSKASGGGFKAKAARAGKIAGKTGANLVKGAWSAGSQAVGASMKARIDRTVGSKIAEAINQGSAEKKDESSHSGFQGLVQPINTLGGSNPEPVDAEAEAAAFVNKNQS